MTKILLLVILILILYSVQENKYHNLVEKPQSYQVLFVLHLICGIGIVLLATAHGLSQLATAPLQMAITGGIALALLWLQLILGVLLKRKHNKGLRILHKSLPVVIILLILTHIMFRSLL